jgi:hypothetical protein
MSTPPGVVNAVRWTELCPWLLLVRAARAALFFRMMALAVVGVWATQMGWSVIEAAFLPDEAPSLLDELTERPAPPLLADTRALWTDAPSWQPFDAVDRHAWAGPLIRGWAWAIQPLTRLVEVDGWRLIAALLAAGVWVMAVWAVVGGAMARMAALYLTRDELIGPIAALVAGVKNAGATFAAPAFSFVVLAVFALLLMFAGLLMRASFLAFLGALVWPVALVIGVVLAIIGIGLVIGWPFMWSTVAAERTDAFDAVSRGYAFVYQRPLHLAFFVFVATVLGVLSQAAVNLIVFTARDAAVGAVAQGMGDDNETGLVLRNQTPPEGEPPPLFAPSAGKLVRFWTGALESLATAFPMAYLFPAAMGIYLLQRRLIDSTELGEVSLEEGAPESGLTPLVTDPTTGVPMVAATPPAASDGAATTAPSDGAEAATITHIPGGPSDR